MPRENAALLAFNRGEVDKRTLARVDVDRVSLSAETQINWMPRVLGSMMLRPGCEKILNTRLNNKSFYLSFEYATDDQALIEFTDNFIRFVINDQIISRASVGTAFTNGGYVGSLTGWTLADDPGCSTSRLTDGVVKFTGNGAGYAKMYQTLTLSGSGEHAIRLQVTSGEVRLKVTTGAGVEYFRYTLTEGHHSIAFTPVGNFIVEIGSSKNYECFIGSISIEASGELELPTVFEESDLPFIRYAISNDVIFLTCKGRAMYKVERRSTRGWSIVKFFPLDGPFREINATPATISSDQLTGDVILTASERVFHDSQAGSLLKLVSSGQTVQSDIATDDTFTNSIRITGVGSTRNFSVNLTDTWTSTVVLQRSDDNSTWIDVSSYTSNTAITYNDGLDNQTLFYRLGVKNGVAITGNVNATLTFSGGSIEGIVQLLSCSDTSLTATARVIKALGGTAATADWYEGLWSGYRGYPSAVAVYEDRLWLAGKSRIRGSVSGQYFGTLESFDESVEGDSGVIKRDLNGGDTVNWLLALNRLMIGTGKDVRSCRSSSFDEPLTPTNFNVKNASTQGAANIAPAVIDDRGVYVNTSLFNASQLNFDERSFDYSPSDLALLNPDIGSPGIVGIAVQRQPDTRVHCWLSDGTVVILLSEPIEEVACWVRYETNGFVEQCIVQSAPEEDKVYYVIRRGSSRFLVRWAKESEAIGGAVNKIADCFVYSAGSSSTITGLNHLEGEEVVAWGNGKDLGSFTVSGGSITLPEAATHRCAGLGYTAKYKSSKLAYASGLGTPLVQKKKISQLGLIMSNVHAQGVQYGKSFTELFDLPKSPNWMPIDQTSTLEDYDEESFPFGGEWDTDSRLCLQAQAPKPCTILAAIISVITNDKV